MPKNIKISDGILNVSSPQNTLEMNVDGSLTVTGNLTVSGTTTTVDTENLSVADNIILLNSDVTGAPTENAGIEINRGTSPNVSIRYNETAGNWELTNDGTNYSSLLAGSGSLSDFAQKSVSETITQPWTFSGEFIDIIGTSDAYTSYNTAPNNEVHTGIKSSIYGITDVVNGTNLLSFDLANNGNATTDIDSLSVGNFFSLTTDQFGELEFYSPEGSVYFGDGTTNSLIFDFTDPSVNFLQSAQNLAIRANQEISFLDNSSSLLDPASGTIELGRIESPNDIQLTIKSGNSVGTDGQDLVVAGGSSDIGFPGKVVIGDQPGPSIMEATGDLTISAGGSVTIDSAVATATSIGASDEEDLILSGGESLGANPGGNLIIKGGASAGGAPGQVIVDSNANFTESVTITGNFTASILYPISFFIPAAITTGSNPNLIMDSVGVVNSAEIQASGHVAYANTAPSSNHDYIVNRIRSGVTIQIGTVSFLSGNSLGSVSFTDFTLAPADVLQIVNPASPDSTIDDITISFKALTT